MPSLIKTWIVCETHPPPHWNFGWATWQTWVPISHGHRVVDKALDHVSGFGLSTRKAPLKSFTDIVMFYHLLHLQPFMLNPIQSPSTLYNPSDLWETQLCLRDLGLNRFWSTAPLGWKRTPWTWRLVPRGLIHWPNRPHPLGCCTSTPLPTAPSVPCFTWCFPTTGPLHSLSLLPGPPPFPCSSGKFCSPLRARDTCHLPRKFPPPP